jgi:hypothetical protein
MATQEHRPAVDFGGPATYRIVVQGGISQRWRDRLVGFTIGTTHPAGKPPRTTLVGLINDQAQLSDLLDMLYGLHLPILAVETLDDAK